MTPLGQVFQLPQERPRLESPAPALEAALREADEELARFKRALVWLAKGFQVHNVLGDKKECDCRECLNVRECLKKASR